MQETSNKKQAMRERGVSLYLAVMIMSVLMVIAFGLSSILFGQLKTVGGMTDSVVALYAADTGIERTLFEFQPTQSGSVGQGPYRADYTVTVVCSPTYTDCPSGFPVDAGCSALHYCMDSIGTFKKTKRAIQIER